MLKKITSEQEKTKKRQRNHILIGVIMIGLMVVSSLGYAFMQNEDSVEEKQSYNGFEFVRTNGLWQLEVSDQVFGFKYLPGELENVSISGYYDLTALSGKPLYIVNNNYASQTLILNLGRYLLRYQEACLDSVNMSVKSECNSQLPKKTCDDNLIIYQESEKTSISQENNCVYISGDSEKGSEKFIYRLLGVI